MRVVTRAMRFAAAGLAGVGLALVVSEDRRAEEAEVRALAASLRSAVQREGCGPRDALRSLQSAGGAGFALSFELLSDREPSLRTAAAAYLALRGCRTAVPRLIRLLRDRDPGVRRTAAGALGAIADPRALPFLERDLGSEDVVFAEVALHAAWRIRAMQQQGDDG